MENTKSELIKIAAQLLVDCPMSNRIEDWDFPLYLSNKQLNRIQRELDKFDSWRKELVHRIKSAADTIEVKNTSTNNTRDEICPHLDTWTIIDRDSSIMCKIPACTKGGQASPIA